ncbi:Glyoxalase/bleomycin resistance protein/dioxygenase [Paenibacillus curdlanolyticus YK9]|uniref:Glyoxalase/bleomycin resistance protein/dioxygenase n=1 Tax=Paenibacillus curdlanolyticus YK9 TaxID=717606 RepID=E0I9R5_9BACL|nr:VOC family protein [Paenibacillus curdlanolyticus]EFM11149.1 Glyoxalase/bleomycin resistance protein/dioxygenase [Paenibacillus curdlanolyticus YK9]
MANSIWINLPVKDLPASEAFFTRLGFSVTSAGDKAKIVVGDKNAVVMLFPEETLSRFTGAPISDTRQGIEVIISIGADSKEEVDAWVANVEQAGGTVTSKPGYQDGWMYGAAFADLDGHRWNLLYMDMSKRPKG